MSVAGSQAQTFLRIAQHLRPRFRTDHNLPRTIQALLAGEKRFGSRDRRLYRELVYTTLRYLPWIEPCLDPQPEEAVRRVAWLAAESPATKLLRAEFAVGEPPVGDRAELLPAWFREHCPEIFSSPELDVQLRRAPVWLRLQTDDPARVFEEFDERGWAWRRSAVLPSAVEWRAEADVTQTSAWRDGLVEIQDLGSQLIIEAIGLEPGGRWLDACAGAGGKSLQLARLLGRAGSVDAHDIRPAALEELRSRALRAGVPNLRTLASTPPPAAYDGVLVDAPCSGSGTWRRAPHLKWTTTPGLVAGRAQLQKKLLTQFAAHVRPGGRLVYATCSLSRQENDEVVAAFLAEQPGFRAEPLARTFGFEPGATGLTLWPSRHDTDGFFVASLRRG